MLNIQNNGRDQWDVRNDGGKTNKTNTAGWLRSAIQHKKKLPLKGDTEAVLVARVSCMASNARGAAKATIGVRRMHKWRRRRQVPTLSQPRIKKGFAKTTEQVPIYDQTSLRKMVMDAASRDP